MRNDQYTPPGAPLPPPNPNATAPPRTGGQPVAPPLLHTPPHAADPRTTVKELQKAVNNAQDILVSASTVFPFTLFPDTVCVDREKLTIAHRMFFRVAEVMSIRIEDILNVTADVGPFFGSLKISTRFFDTRHPYTINYLWRSDALRIKRIMQGYIIALQKGVDCSTLGAHQLAAMLDTLGQGGE
jgi:hypothetical protein